MAETLIQTLQMKNNTRLVAFFRTKNDTLLAEALIRVCHKKLVEDIGKESIKLRSEQN